MVISGTCSLPLCLRLHTDSEHQSKHVRRKRDSSKEPLLPSCKNGTAKPVTSNIQASQYFLTYISSPLITTFVKNYLTHLVY